MNVTSFLRSVRNLYVDGGAVWVQGSYGWLTGPQQPVTWMHRGARGYDIVGAIELTGNARECSAGELREVYDALAFALDADTSDPFWLEHWNDADGRTFADVVHLLETAGELVHA